MKNEKENNNFNNEESKQKDNLNYEYLKILNDKLKKFDNKESNKDSSGKVLRREK